MIADGKLVGLGLTLVLALAGCSKGPAPTTGTPATAVPPSAPEVPPSAAPPAEPASAAPAASVAPSAEPESACEALFEPPPGARKLCSEHVMGNGMEIAWRSYATTAGPNDVFAPYRAKVARCPGVKEGKDLRLEKGLLHLTVHAATEKGIPSCTTGPKPGESTVIVISQATKR